jgi:hypothetical protein
LLYLKTDQALTLLLHETTRRHAAAGQLVDKSYASNYIHVDSGFEVGISFESSAPDILPFEYTSAPTDDGCDGNNYSGDR